jgi:two-component system response regulator AtoC
MTGSILVVDDEKHFLNSVERKLRLEGFRNITALSDPQAAEELLETRTFDAALLDIVMPGMDGLKLLEVIHAKSPQTMCVMVTANEDIPSVIQAMKTGAYDYMVKPVRPDRLVMVLRRALEHKRMADHLLLRQEKDAPDEISKPEAFSRIVASGGRMHNLLREAELHACSEIPVLITGETGTGKELLAQAIHKASPRSANPFVPVNMLSLSGSLFESEFFGHVKGAFTGATQDKPGYLAMARGGTLFLDEIGDLPLEIQGKLLRILQEGEFTPVGKTRPVRADVRFIAATNQDLEALVAQGTFRKDLYYRLRFACLSLVPLRERKEDLRPLARHFLNMLGSGAEITEQSLRKLVKHDWPGNVRELKGLMEAASNLAQGGPIEPQHLNLPEKEVVPSTSEATAVPRAVEDILPLAEVERLHILAAYEALENNKTQTAKQLGIGLATLQRKLKAYGVK